MQTIQMQITTMQVVQMHKAKTKMRTIIQTKTQTIIQTAIQTTNTKKSKKECAGAHSFLI